MNRGEFQFLGVVINIDSHEYLVTHRLKVSEERRLALEESNQKHILKMQETEGRRVNIESELKAERDWRTSLKQIVDEQQEQMTKLQTELDEMRVNSAEYNKLKRDYQLLSKKCSEYELSLEEVGVQLREYVSFCTIPSFISLSFLPSDQNSKWMI